MNLKTKYMGLDLKNPIVPSAAPLSENLDGIKHMEEAGAGAVVMFSLFEEQLKIEAALQDQAIEQGAESFAEALSYFPKAHDYRVGPEQYLELLHKATQAVAIPVIGSLNGFTNEGWVEYARKMQDAGAKGIELNIYHIAADKTVSGAAVEKKYVEVVKAVAAAVDVPVAVKLSPYFSSTANMARKLKAAGADALVLFNRFYQPDFDIVDMEVSNTMNLSTPAEIRLPLRWIAILHGRVKCSLAASSGVESSAEVVKYLLAGADVVMTTSALLKHGIGHIKILLDGLQEWMKVHEYESVKQMKGAMSQKNVADPCAFERANYIRIIEKHKAEYTLK